MLTQRAVLPHLHRLLASSTGGAATDRQLLEEFLARRDPAAFASLMRRHGGTVLGVCQRVLNHVHDAEDAFQATFLVLIRKARSIAKREAVGSWLYGVAYRVALKARADAARRRRQEAQAEAHRSEPRDHDRTVQDVRTALDAELHRLPEKYRQPLVLCYFEGKTYAEAAQLLGWPAGTVSIRLARARRLLGNRLARRGLTVASSGLAAIVAAGAASATVPPGLAEATVQAVLRLSAGGATAGVSSHVLALTEGVVQAMLLRKLKTLTGIVLAVSVLGGGAGILYRCAGVEPASAAQPQPPGKIQGEDTTSPDSRTAGRRSVLEKSDAPGPRPLAPPVAGTRPPQTRIGLINMTQVLKASKKFQAVEAALRTQTQQVQQELEALRTQQRELKNLGDESRADDRERERNARRIRQLQAEIEDKSTNAKRLVADRSGDASVQMYREIEDVANRIAKRDGIELVLIYTDAITEADFYRPSNVQRKLTQPGVLMPMIVARGMDITDTVVAALNR